jgi:hypothetical protein
MQDFDLTQTRMRERIRRSLAIDAARRACSHGRGSGARTSSGRGPGGGPGASVVPLRPRARVLDRAA